MGRNEKGGGFRSPGHKNKGQAENEASPAKGAVGSTPPKQLSEKITSMKFMQKKAAAVERESAALRPISKGVVATDSQGGVARVVQLDGEGSPLVRHYPGRRSFGKFNPTIEEYAMEQTKQFRRAAKELARGGPPVKAEQKQIEINKITGKTRRDETKDISDQEMARVLGKKNKKFRAA